MTATTAADQEDSTTSLYSSPPPPFGHQLLKHFLFHPRYINLNHGSYGSLPRPVKEYCDAINEEAEARPDLLYRLEHQGRLLQARERVAKLIGARTEETVLVPNSSSGLNVVLQNFDLKEGDILLQFSTTYGLVNRTLQYLHDIHPGTTISTLNISFPTTHADIVSAYRDHVRALPRTPPTDKNPSPKIIAVIDSIISVPGVFIPWKELVKISREQGVWSVVDAAHSIGQEVGVDLSEVKPDFWVSSTHKWLFSKRGSGVIYVPERNRHIIKAGFPVGSKYTSGKPTAEQWTELFQRNGTYDWVPYLSINAALDFRSWLGGEEAINSYCRNIARRGGKRLAEILGTRVMDEDGELTLNMVNVELPLPHNSSEYWDYADTMFRERLLREWDVYASHYYHNNRWWTRCSAQVFSEASDFEYLGRAYNVLCAEIREKINKDRA